jgi:small GTP-binding protein
MDRAQAKLNLDHTGNKFFHSDKILDCLTPQLRIVMVGSGAVGLTSLLWRFLFNTFIEKYDPTIEDFYSTSVELEEIRFNVEFIDTAGQEEYQILADTHIQMADVVVLVYSVTSSMSLEMAKRAYFERVLKIKQCSEFPCVLVGNKVDLQPYRQISYEEGRAVADEMKIPFFETSAKDGTNVIQMFHCAINFFWTIPWNLDMAMDQYKTKKWFMLWKKRKFTHEIQRLKQVKQVILLGQRRVTLKNQLSNIRIDPHPRITGGVSTYLADLGRILTDIQLADQTIFLKSGTKFSVHRCFLEARTPSLFQLALSSPELRLEYPISDSSFSHFLDCLYAPEPLKGEDFTGDLCHITHLISSPGAQPMTLSESFAHLLKTTTTSDVTIAVLDGENFVTFKLHKAILVNRCDWFRACFEYEWKEHTGSIFIREIDSLTFSAVIYYLYTDTLPKFDYTCDHLLYILESAERFGLPHLKALCEEYLQKLGCFEKETILDLYTFSVVYHAKQLEELCIYFISQPETFNYLLQAKQNQLRQLEPAVAERIVKMYDNYIKYNQTLKAIEDCGKELKKYHIQQY